MMDCIALIPVIFTAMHFSPLDQSGVGIRFSHFTHPLLLADGCSVNCDVNHTMSLGMLVESRVNLSLVTIID